MLTFRISQVRELDPTYIEVAWTLSFVRSNTCSLCSISPHSYYHGLSFIVNRLSTSLNYQTVLTLFHFCHYIPDIGLVNFIIDLTRCSNTPRGLIAAL